MASDHFELDDSILQSSPYQSNDDEPHEPVLKKVKVSSEPPVNPAMDAELAALNKELHEALSTNVSLHNTHNKALSVLRRINSQNQDLLEALSLIEPELANIPPAPPITLPIDQEERFRLQYSW